MTASSSLAGSARRGIFWLFGQSIVSRAVQALAQVALAWFLLPADFGLIGLATTITAVIGGLFSLGFEDVLLQRHREMRLWMGAAFWLSLTAGCLTSFALMAAAPVGAASFGQPAVVGLICVSALAAPISALGMVPNLLLRASLNFRLLAGVALGEAVLTSTCSVALAAAGFGAYSFVLPAPLAAAARVCILWRATRAVRRRYGWRLTARIRVRRALMLLPKASAALGTSLLTTLVGQGDYIVLGVVVADAAQVGLYFFAFKLAVQPLRMLAGSFSGVLFPTLVQYRNDPRRQRDAALQVSQMLSVIVMPLCFLQATLTGPLLKLFFADRWYGSMPYLQLLSIGLAFDASSWAAGALLHARGQFKRSFLYSVIATPVFFGFVGVGAVSAGVLGVACAVALFYLVVAPLYCYAVFRSLGATGWREITLLYLRPALLSGAAALAAYAIAAALWDAPLFLLGATPVIMLAVYIPLVRLVCPEPYGRIKEQMSALLGARAVLPA